MLRRRIPPLLATLLLAGTAAAAQAPGSRVETTRGPVALTYETFRLPNGLNVILSQDSTVPAVAVNLWYRVGSGDEVPGRTGFAHLFEHMMFQGSQHVGDDRHFGIIQEAGGRLNGSTNSDRTNYYETVPSNFLETVLWLEADRMGFLLPSMTREKLDNQRSVVQNERRQRYENAPYGLAGETMAEMMYPEGHPYSWTTIGSMDDLNAASMEDVSEFFRTYYAPNNASLAIVGDFDPAEARRWVERYFGPLPAGPEIERPEPGPVRLDGPVHRTLEDRVQLPRLYLAWHGTPQFTDDAADLDVLAYVLAGGKGSRLERRLVREEQLAQWVSSYHWGRPLGGEFRITVQARPGVDLDRVAAIVDEELARLRDEPPTEREVQRAVNNVEVGAIQEMQTIQSKADNLNSFYTWTGDPGYVDELLERYRAVTPASVHAAARRYLTGNRAVLGVVPQDAPELGVEP